MNRLVPSLLMLASVSIIAAVFVVVTNSEGRLAKVFTVIVGVALGTGIAIATLTLYGLLPWARRRHWSASVVYTDNGEPLAFLKSGHWHTTRELVCEIHGPGGQPERVLTDLPPISTVML